MFIDISILIFNISCGKLFTNRFNKIFAICTCNFTTIAITNISARNVRSFTLHEIRFYHILYGFNRNSTNTDTFNIISDTFCSIIFIKLTVYINKCFIYCSNNLLSIKRN